ncbi:MAG: SDR family NAD(P)-dependent oxidoreductase [Pseudomonadota bacterium]|nr:SDR family NAD(P)-dependent oxidoreductase [Pseudomonadota bacterium]
MPGTNGVEVAIVGMAGRFPGAPDVETLWRNLCAGVESVTSFTEDQLRARGVPPELLADPDYVRAGVVLDGIDQFDAAFFGYAPREAERLDPQQRLFLECAWEALEDAGYDAQRWPGSIAVYGGAGANVYLMRHLLPATGVDAGSRIAELLGLMSGNAADALCTRVAYKLGLRGPAITVQTACSTSLTAVHLACRSLLAFDCDMALAGGVSLNLLQNGGYRYEAGAIFSPDGHCRAFDAQAAGTVLGSGAGIVVLKRLEDALRDGDTIRAVVKGSAANNDGADKMGFTAPGVQGQAAVIRAAQLIADVSADSIGYVETHGTGTALGDPIEIAALTQAFRAGTARQGFCAIGSLKTNIGHLDAAAGVAGLIKAAKSLEQRTLVPSLHFERAHPQLALETSPFFVNTEARAWPRGATPRRAAVSGFGIGGTNVHVVLEEPPSPEPPAADGDAWHILPLSARDAGALRQSAARLADRLDARPPLSLADVAHTLQVGRRAMPLRRAVIASTAAHAIETLRGPAHALCPEVCAAASPPQVGFLFPGGGTQHVHMGRDLYRAAPVFREELDRCCELLAPTLGIDLRTLIFPPEGGEAAADAQLFQMAFAQPALFAVQYAMARLWMHRGVRPAVMMGHSLGEYVAACLAGVFRLEDALSIVAARGRLMQSVGPGAMTAVALPEAQLGAFIAMGCDIGAVNGESLCVLSGPVDAIETAERELLARGQQPRRLRISIASHSAMTVPLLAELRKVVAAMPRQAPSIPFVSNITGRLITPEEATSPDYWAAHLRGTVRFWDGLGELFAQPGRAVLEVGPGETLCGLARAHPLAASAAGVWASQAHPQQQARNGQQMAYAIAGLWSAGVEIDWQACHAGASRRRVPLPSYPFQRRRHWVEAGAGASAAPSTDWAYIPSWQRVAPLASSGDAAEGCTLVLGEAGGFADRLAAHLAAGGETVARAVRGERFAVAAPGVHALRPSARDDLARWLAALPSKPVRVCCLWSFDDGCEALAPEAQLERGFHSLLALVQALGALGHPSSLTVLASRTEDLTGEDPLSPEAATLFGLCKSAGQEYPHLACRLVDALAPMAGSPAEARLARAIAAEMRHAGHEATPVAYRGAHRWVKRYEPMPHVPGAAEAQRLRRSGVYLVTGGLGGVGLALAHHLARQWGARLGLLGRSACPPRAEWEACVAASGTPAPLRERLRSLLALEAEGAEVLVLQADVADPEQMRDAIATVRARFGALHGVVHAAGDAGGGMIATKTGAEVARVFAPKLAGTRALLDALDESEGAPPDFVLLCSSIASIAGGLGKSDYAAANACLDTMAALRQRDGGCPVFSVNWDAWRDMGMAAGMRLPEGVGMDAQEGARAFERIVSGTPLAQIVVCTTDLAQRLGPLDNGMLELLDQVAADAGTPASMHPRPSLQTPFVAPASALERTVAAIWHERLGISPIGLHDNLFELGGDSLVAIQLLSRVRAACTVELHPSEFFKAPTVAGLVAQVERQGGAARGQPGSPAIPSVPRAARMALSPMQRRLWLVDRLADPADRLGRAAYNIAAALVMDGEVDLALLRETLQALVARHEVLRTVYAEDEDGEPAARIVPRLQLDIPLIEAGILPGAGEAARLEAVFARIGREPFELAAGPLLRAAIVRHGERRHAMVIVVHHIVFDGWSIAVFAREFGAIYQALQAGRAPALAPQVIQYADYAAWCTQGGAGEAGGEQAFWRGYLHGAPPVSTLPADHARPTGASHAGDAVHVRIEAERLAALQRLARETGASLFQVLLAGFFLLAHRESGARDLVVGTDVAGRVRPELESLLGFFVNVIPLRSRVADAGLSARDWLAALRQSVLSAMDHQHTPFDQVVDLLGTPRTRHHNPLVQMLFVLQNTPEARFDIPGVAVEVLPQPTRESKFDLAVFARERGETVEVEWVYATGLYERTSVERMAARWLALLRELTDAPDAPLARFIHPAPAQPARESPSKESASMNSKLEKLKWLAARGRPELPASASGPVRSAFLAPGRSFPVVLEAVDAGFDAVAWAQGQAGHIESLVQKHGGILFRNFGLRTPQDFEAFAESIEPQLYGSYGDLPKKEGGRNTYRSTPYPEQEMILFHNESAHLHRWPRKQWFFCELPAPVGGATPIVDCREMLAALPAEVVEGFERKGLLYVRTFTPGLDVRWQDFYKTDSRVEVEARLAAAGTEWRWLEGDTLQTRTRCPAVIRHPLTGERVFFNQVQLHHASCLDAQVREDLLGLAGLERMPRHVVYGDGSPISDETMAIVGRAYEACAVRFDWRQGDVVMLDNMLAAHARDPYQGPRKIVVAMGAMFERADLEPMRAADSVEA